VLFLNNDSEEDAYIDDDNFNEDFHVDSTQSKAITLLKKVNSNGLLLLLSFSYNMTLVVNKIVEPSPEVFKRLPLPSGQQR